MAFFDEVKKSLTDVSESIVKKSTVLVEVQKLKMKKSSLEGDIKHDFALLGKLYFAKMEADGTQGETPEACQSFERIMNARAAVAEIKEKLSKMNNEKNCRACGARVPLDTIYCPKCGTRFEEAADEAAKAADEMAEAADEAAEAVNEAVEAAGEAAEAVNEAVEAAGEAAEAVNEAAEAADEAAEAVNEAAEAADEAAEAEESEVKSE